MAEPKEWGKKVTVRMPLDLHKRIVEISKLRKSFWRSKTVSETIRDCVVAGIDVIDEGKFKSKEEKKSKKRK